AAGGHQLSGAADHHFVPDLRAGGRHFPVLCLYGRADLAARGVVGRAARAWHRQHALCRHARLARPLRVTPDGAVVAPSVLIAIAAAYGGLRAFLARHGGVQLMLSAVAFGIAVSGMHYTAMYGMHLVPSGEGHQHGEGLAASPQILALVVALLC